MDSRPTPSSRGRTYAPTAISEPALLAVTGAGGSRRARGSREVARADDARPRACESRVRPRTLLSPPANTILGSLLSIFSIAESYKEVKEGVEYAVRHGKLIQRMVASTGGAVVRLRRLFRRRPAPAG